MPKHKIIREKFKQHSNELRQQTEGLLRLVAGQIALTVAAKPSQRCSPVA
jgi:hypothetical protein